MILLGEKEPLLYTCQSGKEMFEECRNRKMRLVLLDLEIEIETDNTITGSVLEKNPLLRTSKKKSMASVWRAFGRL